MADKKFLLEHGLVDAYNKFMHLCNEHTYFGGLAEDGEEEQGAAPQEDPNAMPPQDPNAMGGDPNMMNGDPNGMNQEGDPNAMQGGDDMMQQDPNAMGGDPNMMGEDPNAMGGDMGMDMPPMGDEMAMEEEDEVIDVDDITNAQEKTNLKVNKVGRNLGKVDDKIMRLMDVIANLQTMIDKNNAEIQSFKTEFEKRNPTPTEKMNLRSLDSYPFNDNPTNYWEKKAMQPEVSGMRYQAYADNNEPVAKKEYVITADDAKNFTDNSIRDSFHISDDLRSTIEKIFEI